MRVRRARCMHACAWASALASPSSRCGLRRLKTSSVGVDTSCVNGLVFIWILVSPFVVVGCLKGRYALSIAGLFLLFGVPAILAGVRLARPDSWWAKRKYDQDQLARAA